MKQYFKNVMLALCGNDPYRMELSRVSEEYEKTAERVRQLDAQYFGALEKWGEAQKALEKDEKELRSCQKLVETLRGHIKEKDEQIAQIKEEFTARVERFRKRTADYGTHIAKLQAELDKVKKRNRQAKAKEKQEKKKGGSFPPE